MIKFYSLICIAFLIELTACQQPVLFPLFFQQPVTNPLPPKTPKGRPPLQKMKSCCLSLNQADADCKARFCDFNAISSNNVKLIFK